MKKSFVILASLALALGLVACTPKKAESSEGSEPLSSEPSSGGEASEGELPELPKEEGKVTFAFELAGIAPEDVPEWAGFFMTGKFLEWETDASKVVNFQRLGETNYYYGFGVVAEDLTDFGYQLTMGHNKDSGVGNPGIDWGKKSAECKAGSGDSGVENLNFEVVDGIANLGVNTWAEEDIPARPILVKNITIAIQFAEAVPAWVDVYAPGGFNNWGFETSRMTANEERTVFSLAIGDQVRGSTIEYKLIAEYAGVAALTWSHIIVSDGSDNAKLGIVRDMEDAVTYIPTPELGEEYAPVAYDWAANFPEISSDTYNVDIVVEFAAEVDLGEHVMGVAGTMNGWSMVAFEEGKYSIEVDGQEQQFGVVFDGSWTICVKLAVEGGLENFKFAAEADCMVKVVLDETACGLLAAALEAGAGEVGASLQIIPANAQ